MFSLRSISGACLTGVLALILAWPAAAQQEHWSHDSRGRGLHQGGRCKDSSTGCPGRGGGRLMRHSDHERARRAVRNGDAVPLSWILSDIERTTPGQFLQASLDDENGALVYTVEILRPDGTVSKFTYDAKSGALLKQLDARE